VRTAGPIAGIGATGIGATVALAASIAGCHGAAADRPSTVVSSPTAVAAGATTYGFDFAAGQQGWTGGSSVNSSDGLAGITAVADYRQLPLGLDSESSGLYAHDAGEVSGISLGWNGDTSGVSAETGGLVKLGDVVHSLPCEPRVWQLKTLGGSGSSQRVRAAGDGSLWLVFAIGQNPEMDGEFYLRNFTATLKAVP
jgi:hypothetical protein